MVGLNPKGKRQMHRTGLCNSSLASNTIASKVFFFLLSLWLGDPEMQQTGKIPKSLEVWLF